MKNRICIFIILIGMPCRAEVIKDASYFKVVEGHTSINNTRLLWREDSKIYNRAEYNELTYKEEIENVLKKQLIVVMFFNTRKEQIKFKTFAIYDHLLEKVLIKQLDPKAPLPSDFHALLHGKDFDRLFVDDVVQTSYFDICALY